jgi:Contractile injection system tube protein/LysM domain
VDVMYNPEELKVEQGNNFAEIAIPGLDSAPVQYVRGKARTLSMELFFDTTSDGSDVRIYTVRIVKMLDKRPDTQAPPILIFTMGTIAYRCVLVDAAQRFTMFLNDGTPVRSFLSVRLQEYVSLSGPAISDPFTDLGSGTLVATTVNFGRTDPFVAPAATVGAATVHVSIDGETLQGLAASLLGDPARWRDIAAANGIVDPLNVQPGTVLVIPARAR